MIYPTSLKLFMKRKSEGKSYLHNARYTAADCKHLAPVSLLAPGDRPPSVSLAATSASLNRRLLLLLLQCVCNE